MLKKNFVEREQSEYFTLEKLVNETDFYLVFINYFFFNTLSAFNLFSVIIILMCILKIF